MPPSRGLQQVPFRCINASRSISAPQRAAFSTTTPFLVNPQKKSGSLTGPPKRGTRTLNLKKKIREKTGKPPAPGERKALKKRIVLSNTNALEVAGLADINAGTIADEGRIGHMVGLPGDLVDQLRALEAFKTTQGWKLFRRPACLWRKETVELAKAMEKGQKDARRLVVVGEGGCGKSVFLLQAMSMAFLKGWVVVNLPDAKDLTIAHTEYYPIQGSEPPQYYQKAYTAQLLSQIATANAAALAKLTVTQQHTLPVKLPEGSTLSQLALIGTRDTELAWPVFSALLAELLAPGRPPLFFGLDGFAHAMTLSKYLDREVQPIHAHDLALLRTFIDCLSGKRPLPNGGLVLAADTNGNRPKVPTLDHCILRNEAVQLAKKGPAVDNAAGAISRQIPVWNPYVASDAKVEAAMEGVEILRLGGLSKEEARTVLEYYAASGMLRTSVTEAFVGERWTLSGGGVVGELERGLRLKM